MAAADFSFAFLLLALAVLLPAPDRPVAAAHYETAGSSDMSARRRASVRSTLFSTSGCASTTLRKLCAVRTKRRTGVDGRHGSGARDVLEQRDLADEVARPAAPERPAVALDLHLAVHQDEELAARVALAGQHLAAGNLEIVGELGELLQLLARQPREQGRLAQGIDLRVGAKRRTRLA